MAGRKKKDTGAFDDIADEMMKTARYINALGNSINDKEIFDRLKTIFENIINNRKRLFMLKDYLLTMDGARILIQRGENVSDATPDEIWRAFITRWEQRNYTYTEDELWKTKENPKSPAI